MRAREPEPPAEEAASLLDLTELSTVQRRIMRRVLRAREISHTDLCQALLASSEDQRAAGAELDAALVQLTAEGWLAPDGDGETRRYRAQLRRKPTRDLARLKGGRFSAAGPGKSIWDALDSGHLGEPPGPAAPPERTP